MKSKTSKFFAVFVIMTAVAVYYFDYRKDETVKTQKDIDSQIIKFDENQINFVEITKKNEKIVMQKTDKGWSLLEPIQDKADNDQVEDLVKLLTTEKIIALAKEAEQLTSTDLSEYGLVEPSAVFNIKNNLGQSKKISVGTQKNFEGNSFIRVDSENKVYVASSLWFTKSENKTIYFREKRLYRLPLADVNSVKITSYQDHFELRRNESKWSSPQLDQTLDQNKVRDALKKISEAVIQEYIFDGEPSKEMIKEKGLVKTPVHIEMTTAESTWSVDINQNEKENALYALTDRPTRLVRLDPGVWEYIGNLTLDSLRDRVSVTRFNIDEVKSIYYKSDKNEYKFSKEKDTWKATLAKKVDLNTLNEAELVRTLNRIHDLEISEFIDKKIVDQFKGNQMLILKSESDHLVYQINWGPELKIKKNAKEKIYYYARTQASPSIFALEKSKLDSLGFDRVFDHNSTDAAKPEKSQPATISPTKKVESKQ